MHINLYIFLIKQEYQVHCFQTHQVKYLFRLEEKTLKNKNLIKNIFHESEQTKNAFKIQNHLGHFFSR